jgi:ubiquinone biosynthesis protein
METLTEQFRDPVVVLSALPWVLGFAWVATRLIGARRMSTRRVAAAGLGGYVAGLALAALVADVDGIEFGLIGAAFAVVFTMVAIVGFELLADRPRIRPMPRLPSLPHPVRRLRRGGEQAARLLEVTRIAIRRGLGPALGLQRRPPGSTGTADLAQRACMALEEAGGMFVKLGQLLATRVDVIPPAAAQEFARLHEQVGPADPGDVRDLLQAELGGAVEDVFAGFEWDPLAAASIAQIHRARLHSGERVVVKLQRPGVATAIDRDLGIVRRIARRMEARTEWGRQNGIAALAAEFADRLREELDFTREARNTIEVAQALRDVDGVHVPEVHGELSTARVLVLEELHGRSVMALGVVRGDGESVDRTKIADLLVRAELEPMLAGDRFHADPHPGNVFLLDDGRIGLLDCGATGRLDAFERASVNDLVTALRDNDPTLLREAIGQVAALPEGLDPVRLDRSLARFMAEHLSASASPNAAMLDDLMALLGEHRIRLPGATSTMFRALVTLEGTVQVLDPEFQLMRAAERLGASLTARRMAPQTVAEAVRDEAFGLMPILQRAPRRLDRITGLIERGQIRGHVSLFSDPHDADLVTRLVNRGVLAFAGATLGIVSVLLLAVDAGPRLAAALSFLDVLGYFGLFSGVVLILRVVLAAIRESG